MSFSDFYASDLSDITSSSEDEYKARRSSAKKPKRDQLPAYTIVNPLRPPRSTSYSVRALYEQIVDGSINLDPDYQRDIVWPEQKQIGLIDSVFRNYYIPPIIFAVSTSDDGSESRVCIDGKQRLTSIQKFLDGLIPHRDHVTSKRYWCKKYGANARLLLPTPLQQAFANKQIVCVEYDSLTEEQEREIFQRVQLGVALTPAERMQAIAGPWPNFIREIQSQVLGDDGFGNSFDWGRARGRDFHGLASIAYLIEQLPAHKIPPTAQTMEKWLTRTTPVPPKLRTGVLDTFRVYLSLVREKAYKKAFAQRVSPIEFVMIGVMIFMKREMLSLTQLSNAVEKMRSDVRSVEKDVRSNGRVSKLLFRFILEKLPRLILRSDGQGDKSAQSTLSANPRGPASASPPAATASPTEPAPSSRLGRPPTRKKRKRRVESDDSDESTDSEEGGDDDEYVPTWRRSTGRPAAKVARAPATKERRPSDPDPVPVPASAPPCVSSFALKSEKDKPATPTPTPSLTPHAPSCSSQSEAHSAASAPPVQQPPASTPKIKAEKTEQSTVPGLRTAMDRLAALRAANAHSPASSSTTGSTSPTAVAATADVSPGEPVPGSAIAPIDLEALDKLQQLLTYSAGLKGMSNSSPLRSPLPRTSPEAPGAPVEDQTKTLGAAVLTLQKLGAFLSLPQQQQLQQQATQQGEDPPNAIPIPHHEAKVEPQSPQAPSPTIKSERIEPSETLPRFPRSMRGFRGAGGTARRPNYRHHFSSFPRNYDHRAAPPPPRREYEYERGRPYYRRMPSPQTYSPRSRSRSRSFSPRSRSRSHSRDRERDHGYHSVSPSRMRGWQAHHGAGVGSGIGMGPGPGHGPGPGPGPGPGFGPGFGPGPGVPIAPPGASRPGSISSLGRRRSSPGPVGYAPRKFDFTRERVRREREYQDFLRERRVSAGAPGSDAGGPGS